MTREGNWSSMLACGNNGDKGGTSKLFFPQYTIFFRNTKDQETNQKSSVKSNLSRDKDDKESLEASKSLTLPRKLGTKDIAVDDSLCYKDSSNNNRYFHSLPRPTKTKTPSNQKIEKVPANVKNLVNLFENKVSFFIAIQLNLV